MSLEKETEDFCLGHIANLRRECQTCTEDEFNKRCPLYKRAEVFYVNEDK